MCLLQVERLAGMASGDRHVLEVPMAVKDDHFCNAVYDLTNQYRITSTQRAMYAVMRARSI